MTKAHIAALVPHQGPMCLLEEIVHHDERSIDCRATSHRAASNPLRLDGRLPALAGIEYAAQALAVHGALTGSQTRSRPSRGVLAGVRGVTLHVDRLDTIDAALHVHAELLIADHLRVLYSFVIQAGGRELLEGRIAVVLRGDETG